MGTTAGTGGPRTPAARLASPAPKPPIPPTRSTLRTPPPAPPLPVPQGPPRPINGSPLEMAYYLGGQIQVLAGRLESLREQGAGQTSEFRQLEQMLHMVQDKLIMAQTRIERGAH